MHGNERERTVNIDDLIDRRSGLDDEASLKAWLRDCAATVERDPALSMLIRVLSDLPSAMAAGYADDLAQLVNELHGCPTWRGSNGPRITGAVAVALRAFAEPDVS